MYDFHLDRRGYFDMQIQNTKDSVIPFIEKHFTLPKQARILEIGCGEGGVLKPFIDQGHTAVGVELEAGRAINGAEWMAEEIAAGKMKFIMKDIFKVSFAEFGGKFDLVILKDVIEHLHNKEQFFQILKTLLNPGGTVFFGFPPWQMPFGGHQQMCRNKTLSKMPWIHLLPRPIYRWLLKRKKEPVDDLMEIRDTRISIEGFERLAKKNGYKILGKKHYFIAPIYKYKFKLKPRAQMPVLRSIPWFRNFFTTQVYYIIKPVESA